MSKRLFLAASILSIGGLLAACGTDEPAQDDPDTTTAEDTFEEAVDDAGDEDVPADDATEDATEEVEGTEEVDEAEEAATGSESTETEGTLTASDEQAFELYVLPGYALTAEEPNKDSLYLEEDDSVFMRIESFTHEDIAFEDAESVTLQTLNAVNADAEASELTEFDASAFVQASAYSVPSVEGSVTGITVETEKLIVRFTIFDNSTVNATEDFMRMAETIQPTE